MRKVQPKVYVVARTEVDLQGMTKYLKSVGGEGWLDQVASGEHPGGEEEDLVEFAGRLCYRSWAPGLNPNVSKVRTDHTAYLENVLEQRHGSVLEHVTYSFVFADVSRVLTHELARHRPGTAISQESMRYVRLTDIPFWFPDWVHQDAELMEVLGDTLARLEWLQGWMSTHFGLDEPDTKFSEKKKYTSFMRRFAPDGVATAVMWTANLRTLRHVIEVRTSPAAEEEIRLVFHQVAQVMQRELPALFGDFKLGKDGAWTPGWSKV